MRRHQTVLLVCGFVLALVAAGVVGPFVVRVDGRWVEVQAAGRVIPLR